MSDDEERPPADPPLWELSTLPREHHGDAGTVETPFTTSHIAKGASESTAIFGERGEPKTRRPTSVPSGTLIGRYVVERQLGRGGMGVVLLARDRDLARRVAIKLVQSDASGESDRQRLRMRREAQALAKLEHENIAAIYDTGIHDGQSYIVMQYIEGQNMAEWLMETRRSTVEILSAFLAAARGLAAVHQQGLAHRDFKPANVIIIGNSHDLRVKVVDFGLACLDTDGFEESDRLRSNTMHRTWDRPLTLTGGWVGTLPYMAPERLVGQPRSMSLADQFSFCVSLYEALYDKRPFDIEPDERANMTPSQAQAALVKRLAGSPPHPIESRGDRKLPRSIIHLIMRGLEKNPDNRYPSMTRIVWILQRAVNRARRVTATIIFATLALISTPFIMLIRVHDTSEPLRGSVLKLPQTSSVESNLKSLLAAPLLIEALMISPPHRRDALARELGRLLEDTRGADGEASYWVVHANQAVEPDHRRAADFLHEELLRTESTGALGQLLSADRALRLALDASQAPSSPTRRIEAESATHFAHLGESTPRFVWARQRIARLLTDQIAGKPVDIEAMRPMIAMLRWDAQLLDAFNTLETREKSALIRDPIADLADDTKKKALAGELGESVETSLAALAHVGSTIPDLTSAEQAQLDWVSAMLEAALLGPTPNLGSGELTEIKTRFEELATDPLLDDEQRILIRLRAKRLDPR